MEPAVRTVQPESTKSPAPAAIIPVGFGARMRLTQSFAHYLATGRRLNYGFHYRRLFMFLAIALLGGGAATFLGARLLGADMASPTPLIIGAGAVIALFLLFSFFWDVGRRGLASTTELHGGFEQRLTRAGAEHWAQKASDVINQCAGGQIVEPLSKFRADPAEPYRILTGFAPVPIFALRRPAVAMPGRALSAAKARMRERQFFLIDALCSGLLVHLKTHPEDRFPEDSGKPEIVSDNYTRPNVQQMPDSEHADIFLRFHQSAIERALTNTCRYKTFATLNNFRGQPLFLIRVRDVVRCLQAEDACGEKYRDIIFQGLENVSPETIISLLMENAYLRYPPRMSRIQAEKYEPQQGPLLFKGENDDWAMLFDPARVWVQENQRDAQKYIEALIALRNAIHVVSGDNAIEIKLKKRDVLIVDNRRALIARREDRPAISLVDAVATIDQSLEIRWLRKIYGFPMSSDPAEDNFVPDKESRVLASLSADVDGAVEFDERLEE